MATVGVQDIATTMSTRFDNATYSISTWYKLDNTLKNREQLTIINQGVDNNLSVGNLYVYISNTNATTTISITNPAVRKLAAKDQIQDKYRGDDVYINVQADTQDLCAYIEERDGLIHRGPFDS